MFSKESIPYYDQIYGSQGKNYKAESAYLLKALSAHKLPRKPTLLDVACGTGMHLSVLKQHFRAEGLDVSPEFVRIARKRNPRATFHVGDMRTFVLDRKFDVITCLFSSIGYMTTIADLLKALRNMRDHLAAGGVLLVEPWLLPDMWHTGRVSMSLVNSPELKIVRMNTTARKGRISTFEMHYLVGRPGGVAHFTELHQARLSTVEEMMKAFRKCGMAVTFDPQGPTGRGLYVGTA